MPKIAYLEKRFSADHRAVVERANAIVAEYGAQGYDLTLRQLYYQFVARGFIANKDTEYKRLGGIISDARLAGLIDWDSLVDRTRFIRGNSHWDSPQSMIDSALASYRRDHWEGQQYHVEVWIEKDALVGVIETACRDLDVTYFSCRGYTSQSEMWAAAQRLIRYTRLGQDPVIIHLGDHDPSGIDMSRDIEDRLNLFRVPGLTFERIALNMDQVLEHDPPPNPAKLTDSRVGPYIAAYGDESWELDALDPTTLGNLIREAVLLYRDEDAFTGVKATENEERALLKAAKERWPDLTTHMREQGWIAALNGHAS